MDLYDIKFLFHSNMIAGEDSGIALLDAIQAWIHALNQTALTESMIAKTHERLLKNIDPDIAGNIKEDGMLDDWIEKYSGANTKGVISDAYEEFKDIAPFEDGNGRVGRIITNWQRVQAGLHVEFIEDLGNPQLKNE